MKNLIKVAILFFSFLADVNCGITESSSIKDVMLVAESAKAENILVVFDIDNTLARGKTPMARDEFFSARIQSFMNNGMDFNQAIHHVLPDYYYIQFHSSLVLVEDEVLILLQDLTNNGTKTLALTARSSYLAERTMDQLESLGIRFNFFAEQNFTLNFGHPCFYKRGMLFCGLNDKGEALLSLLDRLNYRPDLVIFVDDKYKNLLSVEMELLKREIPFEGLRLNVCDQDVMNFDLNKAEQELLEFKKSMLCRLK